MKYATLLGLTILMASSPAAMAKVDRDCLRNMRDLSIPLAQAKRMCDSKYDAKPHEWGWTCDGGGGEPYQVKGQGARFKRDVLCE
jgi:hypothetical protein